MHEIAKWLHQNMKVKDFHGNAKKVLNDNVHIQRIFKLLQEICTKWDFSNKLASYGHWSHVTLEAIKQAHQFGLDMVTLPSHTSHALQSFNVSSNFKPFKTLF